MTTTPKALSPRDRDYFDGKLGGSPVGPHILETDVGGNRQAKFGEILDGMIGQFRRAVIATITATGGSGGATAGSLSVAVTDLNGEAVDEAKEILVVAQGTQYDPEGTPTSTVTYATATAGSIVATGAGWALVQTDASGSFACTVSNSADETVYLSAQPAPRGSSDLTGTIAAVAVASNSDDATWAA